MKLVITWALAISWCAWTANAIGQSSGLPVDSNTLPVGQPYLSDTFKDWQKMCVKSKRETDPCYIYQLIKDQENLPIGEITIAKSDELEGVSAIATILTPLGTLLTADLLLEFDSETSSTYPYSWCDKAGCYVRAALSDDEVFAMKKGRFGKIYIETITAPGQRFSMPFSFIGFTAAIGSLR